ncbi:hypothetical protein MAR_014187 [Mya arenaria]|uniref:Uncharacterized protein n=1 Tax=Mya arenaria TaxID=6604 RepID=A0ABY7G211_MYAAR|nr:hypothetical protein MAR_014187 [Mya arenaria]
MCYWAKVRQYQPTDGNAHRSLPEIKMLGTTQVHLASEIEVGDHAFLKNIDGIVCRKEDATRSRTICIYLVCCRFGKCNLRSISVDLNDDWVTVQQYHPAFCRPKKERADMATQLIDEPCMEKVLFLKKTIYKDMHPDTFLEKSYKNKHNSGSCYSLFEKSTDVKILVPKILITT